MRSLFVWVIVVAFFTQGAHSNEPLGDTASIPPSTAPVHTNVELSLGLNTDDSLAAISFLQSRIDPLLSKKRLGNAHAGVVVYSLDAKKYLYRKNADKLFTPASTTKLFATFTSMYAMGSDRQVSTTIYTDAAIIDQGVLDGNLYLVGEGDPYFDIADLEQIADGISNLGITEITGGVYGDASIFDSNTNRYKYSGDADEVQPVAPVTGLSLNRNKVTVVVSSGSKPGRKVRVQTVPSSAAFSVGVSAKVKKGRYYRRSIKVRNSVLENGKQHFTVRGYLKPNRTVSYSYHIKNPALVAADVLKNLLATNDIEVKGQSGLKSPPIYSQPLTSLYRPLHEIISIVNKKSDNFGAEHVFKMVGAYGGADSNTARGAKEIIFSTLEELDIDCELCVINDGSGLSRRNLFTPLSQVELLAVAAEQEFASDFISSLALAGVDGTLKKRMRRTPADGNLVGKTGTLRNVSALSGYVSTLDGERLAFAFLFNGRKVSRYKDIENKIGVLLAEFSYKSALAHSTVKP